MRRGTGPLVLSPAQDRNEQNDDNDQAGQASECNAHPEQGAAYGAKNWRKRQEPQAAFALAVLPPRGELVAVREFQLGEHARDMGPDRLGTAAETDGNLRVGAALANLRENPLLGRSQRIRVWWAATASSLHGATLAGHDPNYLTHLQEQETEFDRRVKSLTAIQRWILDRAWGVVALPISSVSLFGFSSRLQDFAPHDWLNLHDLRRESMWLGDAGS